MKNLSAMRLLYKVTKDIACFEVSLNGQNNVHTENYNSNSMNLLPPTPSSIHDLMITPPI